jgi:hypothetical protein
MGDREPPSSGQDDSSPFDRLWADTLDAEADLLRTYAENLVATGSIVIERPFGVVTARFSGSARSHRGILGWHRRPRLDIDAVRADGSGGSTHEPMVAKFDDHAKLIREIMLHLALYLAYLQEEPAS